MADEQEMTWRLSDAGMDLLERSGLAGLNMALRAAIESDMDLSPLTWRRDDLKPDSVTVRWSGPPKPAFLKLMEWAWQVRNGVLFLPAIHDAKDAAMIQNRVAMHNGIMRTFLQHTNVQPKGESIAKVVNLDENREIEIRYQPPIIRMSKKAEATDEDSTPRKLLRPWSDAEALFMSDGNFKPQAGLSSWAFPGISGRYGDEKRGKAWIGSPYLAILLMLAPTACLYLRLPKTEARIKNRKVWVENWVTVVPDVQDLQDFAEKRPRVFLNPDFVDVGSLGDAAMQFLARYSTDKPRRSLEAGCRAVAMGKVSYYANQSVRKSVLDVRAKERILKRYRILHRELPNKYELWKTEATETSTVKPKKRGKQRAESAESEDDTPKAAGRFRMPAARGRIADNLITGRPWFADLSVPTGWDHAELERLRKRNKELNDRDGGSRPTSHDTILFAALGYQRSKLMKLIAEDDMWDTEAEKVFMEAFWEMLDSLYAQEADAVKRGGAASMEKRWERLEGELYRTLMQAKIRPLLRTALAGWFAKAGRQKSIRSHPAAVWRLIDHPDHWHKGRDLALLALASHRKKEQREALTGTEKGA
jgi:CRISPR-associated protein Cas8a1/Csx13